MSVPSGVPFYKMSGSGNDFVMIDARTSSPGSLADPEVIREVCARGTGVGADGIVFLERSQRAAVKLVYYNADGSRADLCGNATLCTTRLSVELGLAEGLGFEIETDSGMVSARISGHLPEIDLQPVTEAVGAYAPISLASGEARIGFALVGVPHLVVQCERRCGGRGGPEVAFSRHHPSFGRLANVNCRRLEVRVQLVREDRLRAAASRANLWLCGSGAVATAILLVLVGCGAIARQSCEPRHEKLLVVRALSGRPNRGCRGSLQGAGAKIVFSGQLGEPSRSRHSKTGKRFPHLSPG